MPLTEFQKLVLKILAKNRTPETHVAGGIAINLSDSSPRYSSDIDIFNDAKDLTFIQAEKDGELLFSEGYEVIWERKLQGFCRAIIKKDNLSVKLEWVHDSTFRFFPVIADPELGFRLHDYDLATNKILANAGRRESRDFVDLCYLHVSLIHVGIVIWSACGKDPGYTPESLLNYIDRNKILTEKELTTLDLSIPINPLKLRETWESIKEESLELFNKLPADEIGCAYLDPKSKKTVLPDPSHRDFEKLIRHYGSNYGTWPSIVTS